MKSIKRVAVGLCIGTAVTVLAAVQASAGVIISSNDVNSDANDRVGLPLGSAFFVGTTIPTSHSLTLTDGTASSTTLIDYSVSGSSTTLSNTLTHQRPGTQFAYAESYQNLEFSVDVASTYALSGHYSVTDKTSAVAGKLPGDVNFWSNLYDITASAMVTEYGSHSRTTVDESFVLGVDGGDLSNSHTGSLTGSLLVGHVYRWHFTALTNAFPDADNGAGAVGDVTLVVNEKTALPEPTTLAIFCLGLVGLGFMRRRRMI